jgi:hypothetical protein
MGQKESWIWVVEVRLGMEVNEVLVGLMEGRAHSGGSGPGTPYRPSRKARAKRYIDPSAPMETVQHVFLVFNIP